MPSATTDDSTWQYEWEKGRQLKKIVKPGETVEFKYNENGLRIQKVATSTGTTNYTLHGKNIVHMTREKGEEHDTLHFFYDASNKPTIVEYNGVKYAYVHNLQGDIVAILDSNGTVVVQYKYDAWGRQIDCTFEAGNDEAEALSTLNPFRYRGYVYDEETELYYLRSRYYNSLLLRFFSNDALISGNLYTYCGNNPVGNEDANGFAFVSCLDENGFETSFMASIMCGGGGGGGGSASYGHTVLNTVQKMDEEDWINEGKTIAVVALSLTCSGSILKGAHLLGKAFLAEATASKCGAAIGHCLYGVTVANGLALSYAVDEALYDMFNKEYEPPSNVEVVVDFILEFSPIKIPVVIDSSISYFKEITKAY